MLGSTWEITVDDRYTESGNAIKTGRTDATWPERIKHGRRRDRCWDVTAWNRRAGGSCNPDKRPVAGLGLATSGMQNGRN